MLDSRPVASLSDNELLSHLEQLRRRERDSTIEILRHLSEVERRKLHLKLGCSTMFDYCTKHLHYSESAAGRRIQTARCMRRFRSIERLIERDELTLSSVSMIASILNESNVEDILAKIRGKSRREVEFLVANYRPPVKLRDRVQPVRVVVPKEIPVAVHSRRGSGELIEKPADSSSKAASSSENTTSVDAPPAPRTETKLWIQFLASLAFMAKYHEASALLSNRIAKPSFEAVFEKLLDEFLKRRAPRERQAQRERHSVRSTIRASVKTEPRVTMPAKTRDAVFVRDQGRCTYVGTNGRRCNEMHNLHVDHITPLARNGTSDVTNLRLLCARHNQLEAERVLGKTIMDRYRVK